MSAGLVLGARYRLDIQLGEGGFGSVWRGHDSRLERDVAVKLLHAGVDVPRFKREAHALAQLSHPNIVAAHDFGIEGATAYLVLELITGRTVGEELVAARAAGQVGLPLDRVLQVADQVLAGLGAAHGAGLIHRDLKPANIMAVSGGPEVKIVDFGIARSTDSSRMTAVGSVLGTLPYMAPEQFDDAPLDGRVDLYSLGCVLHELLTGVSPYQAKNTAAWIKAHHLQAPGHVRDRRPELPAAVDAFIQLLLTKDPAGRPANAAAARAVVAALPRSAAAAAATGFATSPPGATTPAVPPLGGGQPQVDKAGGMAVRCRKCGHVSPVGTQFCSRAGCGEYLGWGTQALTGMVSGSAAVPVGLYTQRSAASIRLSASELLAAPGAMAATTAVVHNGGSQVEEFTVTVAGAAAAWATVEPAALRIFPQSQAECTVRFAPPRHSSAAAGKTPFTISAASNVHRSLVASADGTLQVGAFHELRATLVPAQTRGRGRTVHTVELANDGNASEAVRLTASDRTATVRFRLPSADVWIPPGSMAIDMPVTSRRRILGRPRHYQFQVTVAPVSRPAPVAGQATPSAGMPVPLRLDGMRESLPLIPGWIPRLAATLATLLIGAVVTTAVTHTGPFQKASLATAPSAGPGPNPAPTSVAPPQPPSSTPLTLSPAQLLLQAVHKTEGNTLTFRLVLSTPGGDDTSAAIFDGEYEPGIGEAYDGPALDGSRTGQPATPYVATGRDFYVLCGPTVDPNQCPFHVDMTRSLSSERSGIVLVTDPLLAFRLLETVTSVTGDNGSYAGTFDLTAVSDVSPAAQQFAEYFITNKIVNPVPFEATQDGNNQLTRFHAIFDDGAGNKLDYDLTLSRFGAPVTVNLPNPTEIIEADPSWYSS